ncbi:MAG: hypothetical protein DYH13_04765 [Alphaproteobacteria bacterium PRO2]|nr:hypothetical protein [Alphaproteobacteria bacterium PRO2]
MGWKQRISGFFGKFAASAPSERPVTGFRHEQVCHDVPLSQLAEIVRPVTGPSNERDAVVEGWQKLTDAVNYMLTLSNMNPEYKHVTAHFFIFQRCISDVTERIKNAPEKCASVALPVSHMDFLSEYAGKYLKQACDWLSPYKIGPDELAGNVKLLPAAVSLNGHVETLEKLVTSFENNLTLGVAAASPTPAAS